MPEQIKLLHGEEGAMLLIRGEDPHEIHRLALDWVRDEEDPEWVRVCEGADEVTVQSIRAVGWCPQGVCECGGRGTHYMDAQPGSRGSFRGAFVALHYLTTDEKQSQGELR